MTNINWKVKKLYCYFIGVKTLYPYIISNFFTDIASYKIYFTKRWNCKSMKQRLV